MRVAARILIPFTFCTLVFAQFPPQLKNVVVIVQENRTPDNLFHFLRPHCPVPSGATGYAACTPTTVTTQCYNISDCGLSNQSGTVVAVPFKGVTLSGSPDPSHNHAAFELMCDPDSSFKCRNDGAWQTAANNVAYSYVLNPQVTNFDGSTGHLLDPYVTLAKQYGWANFMYQTNQGPSWPAHLFLFAGTSARSNREDSQSIFVAENPGGANQTGCLLPASTGSTPIWDKLIQPATPSSTGCTLYDNNSVAECQALNALDANYVGTFCGSSNNMATTVLDPNSISWKYYAPTTTTSTGYLWTAPMGFRSLCNPQPSGSGGLQCTGAEWSTHLDLENHGTDILRDIAGCKLPQISWVIPDGAWSDHAGPDDRYGPSWVAAVVNAIGNNPTCPAGTPDAGQKYWNNTAIVITWDDWGGWSDHQPAQILGGLPCVYTTPPTPCPGDYQYGFRVPLLVVSAYTPVGFIHNPAHDFGSILRMIEGIVHVKEGIMLNADARSNTDLHAFFTLAQPRPYQTVPAVKDANFFLNYSAPAAAPDND